MGLFFAPQYCQPGEQGWFWFDVGPNKGTRIKGATREELFRNITNYRRANYEDLGDPPNEWLRFVCESWPTMCQNLPDLPGEPNFIEHQTQATSAQSAGNLGNRVAAWLGEVHMRQYLDDFVPETLAQSRANICKACPKSDRVDTACCGHSLADLERFSFALRRGRVQGQDLPGGCLALGCDTRVVINLPQRLLPKDIRDTPAHCWIRKEHEAAQEPTVLQLPADEVQIVRAFDPTIENAIMFRRVENEADA